MRKNKGITLVSLVITIIVMLILAGVSLSMVVGDNSVLKQASKATISKKLSEIKEEFTVEGLGSTITAYVNRTKREVDTACVMGDDLQKYIPGIDDVYKDKIAIFNGELVFLSAGATEEEIEIAKELGYIMMDDEDYYYMYNMYQLASYLKAYSGATLPATQLGGVNGLIEISGINYGNSWYKLEASQLTTLGFSPEDASTGKFGAYGPFVVRFSSGEVLSKPGKIMYAGTDRETKIHTFNYKGEVDGVVIDGLLAGVDKTSTKTGTQFGAFSNANGNFSYNGNGGLVFTHGGAIGELGINQSVYINKEYTINVTVKCDVHQIGETSPSIIGTNFPDGLASYHRAIIAVSDQAGDYVCWMGVDQGRLRIYSFRRSCNGYTWSSQPYGFMSVDVSEYDDKYMNIQFSATKNGETKLYINGELKESGLAGKENFSYNTLTIGDLRKNRGLNYIGEMYNLLIYGRTLTAEEALQNYNAIKKELGF